MRIVQLQHRHIGKRAREFGIDRQRFIKPSGFVQQHAKCRSQRWVCVITRDPVTQQALGAIMIFSQTKKVRALEPQRDIGWPRGDSGKEDIGEVLPFAIQPPHTRIGFLQASIEGEARNGVLQGAPCVRNPATMIEGVAKHGVDAWRAPARRRLLE